MIAEAPPDKPHRSLPATLLGCLATLMWSALTTLTAALGPFPPFELMALTFCIGGLAGLATVWSRGTLGRLRQPLGVWMLGIGGIFGDYALFFWSLRLAPAAQANLLSYLWPLLTVLFAAMLPGERLRPRHVVGSVLGLIGVAVLAGDTGGAPGGGGRHALGYALALGSAVVWAGYSVLSRRLAAVPSETTYGFCLGTAVLAALVHAAVEPTRWPHGASQIGALLAIGLGPAGLAFFVWDLGVKRGDIRLLGILSYATPVLSTLLLVVAGRATPTPALAAACALIAAAALVGAGVTDRRRHRAPARPDGLPDKGASR